MVDSTMLLPLQGKPAFGLLLQGERCRRGAESSHGAWDLSPDVCWQPDVQGLRAASASRRHQQTVLCVHHEPSRWLGGFSCHLFSFLEGVHPPVTQED